MPNESPSLPTTTAVPVSIPNQPGSFVAAPFPTASSQVTPQVTTATTPFQTQTPATQQLPNAPQPGATLETSPVLPNIPAVPAQDEMQMGSMTLTDLVAAVERENEKPLKVSFQLSIARWVTVLGLTIVGIKGFLDSLYFNTVEFQNFEKALEAHLIETNLINQLILKATLLIFSTALSVFLAMQLSVFNHKGPRWVRVILSFFVGIGCFFVLQYAATIQVVDVFR